MGTFILKKKQNKCFFYVGMKKNIERIFSLAQLCCYMRFKGEVNGSGTV